MNKVQVNYVRGLQKKLKERDKEIKYLRDCLRRSGRDPAPFGHWSYMK
jgi:hypothetical protein